MKENISEDKQQSITKLIEQIRQDSQSENFESLRSQVEELKTAMKEMLASKMDNESNSDSMSDLNDL